MRTGMDLRWLWH